MYRKGSGEASVHFPSLIQIMMDPSPDSLPTPLTKDPNKHSGQRTASPERQFTCDGWCRKEQVSAAPEHGDVVCWGFNSSLYPSLTPLFFEDIHLFL